MSPEQASGDAVDARSDIYALGVVGHYMLSGKLPLEGATVAATLAKQITQAAPALSSVAPEVPRHLTEAIDRCLAKDPAERFAGGEELAEAMARALEARKELPAAIRNFAKKNLESSGSITVVALFAVAMLVADATILVLFGWEGVGLPAILVEAFALVALAVTPVAMLAQLARKLLASGHDYDELIRALRSDVEVRREELASEYGARASRIDKWVKRVAWGSFGVAVAAIASLPFPVVPLVIVDVILAPAMITALGAGLVAAVRHELRRHLPGGRWLRFWESRLGKWTFKLAGLGLDRLPSVGGSYHPTEMAIGLAADRLFEDLPKDVRKSFAELPGVLRSLEAHAERTRARVKELNGILADLDRESARAPVAAARTARVGEKRESLANDVRAARDAAEERLTEVVAAIESIRLGLLRMHAGVGSMEGMTADLGSARGLAEDLQRLVEGTREADKLLGRARPDKVGDTPTPQPA
jgi:serine/threonine-protein kinase